MWPHLPFSPTTESIFSPSIYKISAILLERKAPHSFSRPKQLKREREREKKKATKPCPNSMESIVDEDYNHYWETKMFFQNEELFFPNEEIDRYSSVFGGTPDRRKGRFKSPTFFFPPPLNGLLIQLQL